jgi:hypothetical protein
MSLLPILIVCVALPLCCAVAFLCLGWHEINH